MTPVVGRDTSHAPGRHHKQLVESPYSARYSGWDDDKAWSSQEWKADELMDDRTETPVVCSRTRTHEFQSLFSREHKHVINEEEENHDRKVQPVVDRDVYSARYSRWDDDKVWSSQEWKADKSMDDRTGQPVVTSWRKTHETQSSFSHEKT